MGTADTIINEHCVPQSVIDEQGYVPRYEAAVDWFNDNRMIVTDVAMESNDAVHTTVMEILAGQQLDENKFPGEAEHRLDEPVMVTLATIDGKPFAGEDDACHVKPGIKVGQKPMSAEKIRTTLRRGDTYLRYRSFGAEFVVEGATAVNLLKEWGYRTTERRYTSRGTPEQKDHWILYEVGGPLEEEVMEKFSAPKKRK